MENLYSKNTQELEIINLIINKINPWVFVFIYYCSENLQLNKLSYQGLDLHLHKQ